MKRITLALTIVGLFCASASQAATYGTTLNMTVGIVDSLLLENKFNFASAEGFLTQAVGLMASDDDHPEYCDDYPACINLISTYWGSPQFQRALEFDSMAEAEIYLANLPPPDWPNIKVHWTVFLLGKGYLSGIAQVGPPYNFVMAVTNTVEDIKEDSWAHEFGHGSGLSGYEDDDAPCVYNLMRENPGETWRDQLTSAQRDTIIDAVAQAASGAGQIGTETVSCDPTGVALLEDLEVLVVEGGVEIGFGTVWEVYTSSFEVFRLDESTGAVLYPVGTPTPVVDITGKHYSILDPNGVAGSVYRIVEHQTDGRGDLFHKTLGASVPPPPGAWASDYDADSLASVVNSYVTIDSQPPPWFLLCGNSQPSYALLCPDSLSEALLPYESMWKQRGVTTGIRRQSIIDSCFGSYREYIKFAAARGTTHFLLVGDANDFTMHDDSTLWVNGWYRRGPRQPEKDIIPTFYTAITDPPSTSWTAYTPYYASDLPYSDIDDDGLPDVVVGRLPVSSVGDVNAYTAKLATWLTNVNGNLTRTAALFTIATNYSSVPAWPSAAGRTALMGVMTPSVEFTEFYYNDGSNNFSMDSMEVAAEWAARGHSDVIVWNLNSTSRYSYNAIWALSDSTSNLPLNPSPRPFLSVGLSCDMNDFDQSEGLRWVPPGYRVAPVRPIVERLLFDPAKGAIAQVAPTRGSELLGNILFGTEFLRRLYEAGHSLGSGFLLAQRNAIIKYPRYRDLFKSYVLLGDPRLGMTWITGVEPVRSSITMRLLRPRPNPFNPWTELRYFLDRPGVVSLTLFDVRGRVVRRLLPEGDRNAGWHEVRWDGRTERGTESASGVYYAVLRAGMRRSTQRLVLLR